MINENNPAIQEIIRQRQEEKKESIRLASYILIVGAVLALTSYLGA